MTTSVIICTKDRIDDLEQLFMSLSVQTCLPDELIVVDASQNDETSQFIQKNKDKSPFRIIYKKTSAGLTHQRNIGVELCRCDYIFFFDDDVVLEENYIEATLQTFSQFESINVGGVMGRITNTDGVTKYFDQIIKKLFFLSDCGRGIVKLSGFPSVRTGPKLSFVESMPGGCVAYSKEVFKEYNFDENLKEYAYMEDVDFSYRVGKKFKLLYQPKARLKHFSTTFLKADTRKLRKMLVRHHRYLFHKNMPKDLIHISAHWISIVGIILYNIILQKDFNACRGAVQGLSSP